jgi:hypothetical protein
MQRVSSARILSFMGSALFLAAACWHGQDPQEGTRSTSSSDTSQPETAAPKVSSLEAARGQAKLLHETIHSVLQFVHRDFYRPDQRLPLPARTLESVFEDIARECNVQVHWLAVQGAPMSIRHQPQDEFERKAVKALDAGAKEFEEFENKVYRRAGAITLHNQCLKCHVPDRTNTEPRIAGLVITMTVDE